MDAVYGWIGGVLAATAACGDVPRTFPREGGGEAVGGSDAATVSSGATTAAVTSTGAGAAPQDCVGCGDTLHGTPEPICGLLDDRCEPNSSCEKILDLFVCACGDSTAPGPCAEACGGGRGLCDYYVPPTTECEACLATDCSEAYEICTTD